MQEAGGGGPGAPELQGVGQDPARHPHGGAGAGGPGAPAGASGELRGGPGAGGAAKKDRDTERRKRTVLAGEAGG